MNDSGIPLNSLFEMPSADDQAAWLRMKGIVDGQYAAALASSVGGLRSSLETLQIDEATVHVAKPEGTFERSRAVIDLHGGALVFGGGEACRVSTRRQADLHRVACYGIDYRTPPEHPFPAGLDDCVTAYRHILERHSAKDISLIGRSAGGNLAAALLLRASEEGLPVPSSLVLLSPEVDLTESGDSFITNQMVDLVLPRSLMSANLLYAGGVDLASPQLSPLFGDLRCFPPVFLQSGTRDLFLSNTVRMHRALLKASVEAELHVFEGMPHGGFTGGTPEDRELESEVARFIRTHWS
jgi:acetyl esterase/lipase